MRSRLASHVWLQRCRVNGRRKRGGKRLGLLKRCTMRMRSSSLLMRVGTCVVWRPGKLSLEQGCILSDIGAAQLSGSCGR